MTETLLELERPTKLSQIKGQDEAVELFLRWNQNRNHPHLIVHGPWGVGKSAAVTAMLLEFYGKTFNYNVVRLNASKKSERSIEAIEQVIKKMSVKPSQGYPYRVFLFEEGEQLTGDAEKALKEAMVEYSKNAKVVIITNHPNKIDGGIWSRCTKIEMTYPSPEIIQELISEVYERHIDKYPDAGDIDEFQEKIIKTRIAPRDALVELEFMMTGGRKSTNDILVKDLSESIMKKYLLAMTKPMSESRLIKTTMNMYDDIVANVGHFERDILKYMFALGKTKFNKYPRNIGIISELFAITDINLQNTSNPGIHMTALLTRMATEFADGKK